MQACRQAKKGSSHGFREARRHNGVPEKKRIDASRKRRESSGRQVEEMRECMAGMLAYRRRRRYKGYDYVVRHAGMLAPD